MKQKLLAIIGVLVLATLAIAGCGGSDSLNVVGSTSVQPIVEMLAEAYQKDNPGVSINVQGGGSSAGIKAVTDGTAEIGTSSRLLKPGEQKNDLKVVEIAIDGIAIITHPGNPVQNLTLGQLQSIYSGKITNWSQVGGPNQKIVIVNREEGSGTRGAFTELVMGAEKSSPKTLVQGSTGAVRQAVSGNPDAIGYISLDAVDASVEALSINGVACNHETVQTKKYPIIRPFLFIYPQKAAEPIEKFVQYVLGEGQQIVAQQGLVPISVK